jgi:hypothetical protein
MLWQVDIVYDDGRSTSELVHSTEPITLFPKRDGIKSSMVSRFSYEVEYHIAPTLFNANDKRYIIPMWQEVHPDTGFEDLKWIRPVIKEKKITEKIQGSMGEYKTTYDPSKKTYKCTCMGYYRAKDRRCKHIKILEEKVLKN